MEILFILGFTILGYLLIYIIMNVYDKLHLRFIDDTNYKYYEIASDDKHIPLNFKYKGHDMIINISTNVFDRGISCYDMKRTTYFINEKPVACLSNMECTMLIQRFMYFNSDYDTSEFYKILKAARKTHDKKWNENWKERYNSETRKLY